MRGGKFLPAFFVEPVELGTSFQRGKWPLHMSLFAPVETSFEPELAQLMREYVNPMEPFMATIGKQALFGDNEDLPVYRIAETP